MQKVWPQHMGDSMQGRALPTFVIIGAQKSATRWLRTNLGEHPDIFAARSEMHFWNNGHRVRKLGIEHYAEQFEGWRGERIVGEATPGYMIWRHHPALVAQRIDEHLPDVRLIAILRNPIDRAQSAMVSTPGQRPYTTVLTSWRKWIASRFSRPPNSFGIHSPSLRE